MGSSRSIHTSRVLLLSHHSPPALADNRCNLRPQAFQAMVSRSSSSMELLSSSHKLPASLVTTRCSSNPASNSLNQQALVSSRSSSSSKLLSSLNSSHNQCLPLLNL